MRTWLALICLLAAPASADNVPVASEANLDAGGGPVPINICLPATERDAINARIGTESSQPRPRDAGVILYADPMDGGINSFGRTIVNYVDLDPSAGLLDYHCGATTYDGHRGLDVEVTSFYDMDEGVPIHAAAPGIVVDAHDGEFDRQTAWNTGALANYVVVQQADGSYVYYYHMRKGSVAVSVGQPVSTGDVLGMVGSSGFSSGPHLHFETWDGMTVDPFNGTCQAGASWWASPPAYAWAVPFETLDHGVTTMVVTWPSVLEKMPSKVHFRGGGNLRSWVRLRNVQAGDQLIWRSYRNGSLVNTVMQDMFTSYTSSWWWSAINITNTPANYGSWEWQVWRSGYLIADDYFTVDGVLNGQATIANRYLTLPMDTQLEGQFQGVDPDGSIFWYRISSGPFHGTLEQYGGRARRFRYTPNPGFRGLDSLMCYAVDDENASGPLGKYTFEVGAPLAAPATLASGGHLLAPRPNPMANGGELSYSLAGAARVRLVLCDVGGRVVQVLDEGERTGGEHRVRWDGRDAEGRTAPAGVYFATLATPGLTETRRVVSVR